MDYTAQLEQLQQAQQLGLTPEQLVLANAEAQKMIASQGQLMQGMQGG